MQQLSLIEKSNVAFAISTCHYCIANHTLFHIPTYYKGKYFKQLFINFTRLLILKKKKTKNKSSFIILFRQVSGILTVSHF